MIRCRQWTARNAGGRATTSGSGDDECGPSREHLQPAKHRPRRAGLPGEHLQVGTTTESERDLRELPMAQTMPLR